MITILKNTFIGFSNDRCTTLAASIAYYTVFALPPVLFILVILITTSIRWYFGNEGAEERAFTVLEQQLSLLVGNQTAQEEIGRIMRNNEMHGSLGWKAILSLIGILIGATGVVATLQSCLNFVWGIKPDPEAAFWTTFLFKRVLSLTMILGLGFVLLISFLISAVLNSLSNRFSHSLGLHPVYGEWINHGVSFCVITLIFAAIFKFMPDAKIWYRDVWVGAVFTTILFFVGRIALTYYLSFSNPGEQLGAAAAALVVILVWVYYNSTILLLGAEFTKAWVQSSGRQLVPEDGAVKFEEKTITL